MNTRVHTVATMDVCTDNLCSWRCRLERRIQGSGETDSTGEAIQNGERWWILDTNVLICAHIHTYLHIGILYIYPHPSIRTIHALTPMMPTMHDSLLSLQRVMSVRAVR